MDCIFCKIINNEIPSKVIYEDDLVLVFLDINPSTNGDCLLIPKLHVETFLEIDNKLLSHLNKVAKEMYRVLKEKLDIEGLTIVNNNFLGQDIKHFHIHLTPRYKNDNLKHNFNKENLKSLEEIHNILIN